MQNQEKLLLALKVLGTKQKANLNADKMQSQSGIRLFTTTKIIKMLMLIILQCRECRLDTPMACTIAIKCYDKRIIEATDFTRTDVIQ